MKKDFERFGRCGQKGADAVQWVGETHHTTHKLPQGRMSGRAKFLETKRKRLAKTDYHRGRMWKDGANLSPRWFDRNGLFILQKVLKKINIFITSQLYYNIMYEAFCLKKFFYYGGVFVDIAKGMGFKNSLNVFYKNCEKVKRKVSMEIEDWRYSFVFL